MYANCGRVGSATTGIQGLVKLGSINLDMRQFRSVPVVIQACSRLSPREVCCHALAPVSNSIVKANSTLATLAQHQIRKLSFPEVCRLKRPLHIGRKPLIRRPRDRFDQKPCIPELQIDDVLAQ